MHQVLKRTLSKVGCENIRNLNLAGSLSLLADNTITHEMRQPDDLSDTFGQRARAFIDSWISKPRAESHVHVRDPASVSQKIAELAQDGIQHLHIIADFDMTMTKYLVNGKRGPSSHAVIKNSPTTTAQFRERGQQIYDQFYPLEIDRTIAREQKYKIMEQWWRTSHDLMVAENIHQSDLKIMVEATPMTWRDKIHDLINITRELNIYFMVFSAGVKDIISEILKQANLLQSHIHIVSNQMMFDDQQKLIAFKEPVIHTLNKSEIVFQADSDSAHQHLEAIKDRNNVILLGDSLGDAHMADGVHHRVALRIGYCNHDVDAWLDDYANTFDVVVLDDHGFDWVISLLQLIRNLDANTVELAKIECTPGEEEVII